MIKRRRRGGPQGRKKRKIPGRELPIISPGKSHSSCRVRPIFYYTRQEKRGVPGNLPQ